MNFLKAITESIFPEKCVGCGARGALICDFCKNKIPSAETPEYGFITSVFSYTDPRVRKLILLLKYGNGRRVAKIFAPYLLASLTEFLGEEKLFQGCAPVLLVPVPLTKKRMNKRGYNQSQLLVEAIVRNDSTHNLILEKNLVSKIKDTVPQAEIKKRAQRLSSQHDCFCVLPNKKTKNEIIILVDDVTTTGATLKALHDLLKSDGFKKVYALTVAH